MMKRKIIMVVALICMMVILTQETRLGLANNSENRIDTRAIEGKLYMTLVETQLLADIKTETTLLSPKYPDPFNTPTTLVKSVKRLTPYTPKTWDESPSFSPDGTKIVFESCTMGWDSPIFDDNVWIIDIDGRNKTRLTKNKYYDGFPCFSPDGTKILYESYSKKKSVFIMDSGGSSPKQVATGEPYEYWNFFSAYPSWSPNGSKIVFEKDFYIYVMDNDGRNLIRLSPKEVFDSYPSWSPDGNKIVFISWKLKNKDSWWVSDIWTMDSDGSSRKQLTDDDAIPMEPYYSPNGDMIIFTLKDLANCDTMMTKTFWTPPIEEPPGHTSIILKLTTTYIDDTKELTDYVNKTTTIELPDGRRITFKSPEFGICTIWMMNSDGTNKQQLTSKYSAEQPKWSPDGSKIVFSSNGDIWMMTLNVTPIVTHTPEPTPAVTPTPIQLTPTPVTPAPKLTPLPTPSLTPASTQTATGIPPPEEKEVLGFEMIFAIAGLLAVVYLLRKRR